MKRTEEEIIVEKEDKYNDEYYLRILNKERHIILYNVIEPCSAEMVVTKIKAMNIIDKKQPIILEINSPGGDVSCGFSIINAMEQSSAPITTIISGHACSMAALISVMGKHRQIYYNSYWMNHPLSEGHADYLNFIKDRTTFLIHLDKMTERILTAHTKLAKKDLQKINTGELWLSADSCLEKGIVDRVIK
jgi:ATP-dependent Clp protease protease subunit